MKLLFVGDFRTDTSSGYAVILKNVCQALAEAGHHVVVLGEKWPRKEHYFSFQVIPTEHTWIPVQVLRLQQALQFDWIILAMDVPKLLQILQETSRQGILKDWPRRAGLFPIESDPLVGEWAAGLLLVEKRFVISRFGQTVLKNWELDSTWLPMTSTMPNGKEAGVEELLDLAVEGNPDLLRAEPWILTIANNQERKDLPVIAEALHIIRREKGKLITWCLVTDRHSGYGWAIDALLSRFSIADQTVVYEHLTDDALRGLYRLSDAFVIASQAEGACLPLYEAMAYGLTVVAPNHTAITEALEDSRGYPVEPSWTSIHPWGNVNRYHTSPEDLAHGILCAIENPIPPAKLREFIVERPWTLAAKTLEEAL
jgi:glycosyltransferase involved in cell wall biosynthesis